MGSIDAVTSCTTRDTLGGAVSDGGDDVVVVDDDDGRGGAAGVMVVEGAWVVAAAMEDTRCSNDRPPPADVNPRASAANFVAKSETKIVLLSG